MMKKRIVLGILVVIFEMTVVGCYDISTGSGNTTNNIPAPTGLNAISLSASSIKLSWSYVIGAASYIVYRDSASGYQIIKAGLQETNYTDTGLDKNTTYTYKIAAQNGNIIGTQSSTISVRTGNGVLKSDMTPQQMLECTSGSISITEGQWNTLKTMVIWVVESEWGASDSMKKGGSYTLSAYEKYLKVYYSKIVTTGNGIYQSTSQCSIDYRYYR